MRGHRLNGRARTRHRNVDSAVKYLRALTEEGYQLSGEAEGFGSNPIGPMKVEELLV